MRYSANLNVILKAIEKATVHMPRDFTELEHLQSNPATAEKFAAACYRKVKKVLIDDLSKIRPEYNLIFADGEKLIRSENAEYSYIIFPIDGFSNLMRSNPDFTVAVALEHKNKNGEKEGISVAISKIFGGELYYCEKGFGAYLNNRRIRVSKRTSGEILSVNELEKSSRNYGSRTLALSYLASCRIEKAIFSKENHELLKPFLLLVKEAGGRIVEDEKSISALNA
jgi:fructose-1,6-bisphosphatase/inositol monophosphatase family enzyme